MSMGNTRKRILAAALETFSQRGFDLATQRQIALKAGVNPALMVYYFKSKEDLFYESIRESVFVQVDTILNESRMSSDLGSWLIDGFLRFWDPEEHQSALIAFFKAGISNERIGARLHEYFENEIPSRLKSRVKNMTQFRMGLFVSQLIGLVVTRYILRLGAMAEAERSDLVDALSPTVTRYLQEPLLP